MQPDLGAAWRLPDPIFTGPATNTLAVVFGNTRDKLGCGARQFARETDRV
jgi:hypothetical protein